MLVDGTGRKLHHHPEATFIAAYMTASTAAVPVLVHTPLGCRHAWPTAEHDTLFAATAQESYHDRRLHIQENTADAT